MDQTVEQIEEYEEDTEILGEATYSFEDNKLRFYAHDWVDREIWEEFKKLGFKSAPKQKGNYAGLFVAPMWTPAREDLCIKYAGTIDDEDVSLADRAEMRAERFDNYSHNAKTRGHQAYEHAENISSHIPFGQPIMVGHHSEKRARKDQRKIENAMRYAAQEFGKSTYWKDRAQSSIAHAKRKNRPDVVARRIKKLKAELRKFQRELDDSNGTGGWLRCYDYGFKDEEIEAFEHYPAKELEEYLTTFDEKYHWLAKAKFVKTFMFRNPSLFPEFYARLEERRKRVADYYDRWIEHTEARLIYETSQLEEAGGVGVQKVGLPLEIGGAVMCFGYPLDGRWQEIIRLNKSGGEVVSVSTTTRRSYRNREIVNVEIIKGVKTKAQWAEMTEQEKLENIVETRKREMYQPKPESDTEKLEREAREKAEQIGKTEIVVHHGLDYYFTSEDTAWWVAGKLNLSTHHGSYTLLEPSAGNGHLIDAVLDELRDTDIVNYAVYWCENYLPAAQILREKYQGNNRIIHLEDDFLAVRPAPMVDRILMNPPWKNGIDRKHVQHAYEFLNEGGRLVAIVSNGTRHNEKFNDWLEDLDAQYWWDGSIEPGAFMGTQVGGSVLVIQR